MNRKEKALVMGFVEYLQGVYGEGGAGFEAFSTPSNSLLVPLFVGADEPEGEGVPDFGAIGSAMGGGGPDMAALLQQIDSIGGGGMGADPMGMGSMGMGAEPDMMGMGMDPMAMGMMG